MLNTIFPNGSKKAFSCHTFMNKLVDDIPNFSNFPFLDTPHKIYENPNFCNYCPEMTVSINFELWKSIRFLHLVKILCLLYKNFPFKRELKIHVGSS